MSLLKMLASLLVHSTGGNRHVPEIPATTHWCGSSDVFIPRRWRRSYVSHRREARRRRNLRLFRR